MSQNDRETPPHQEDRPIEIPVPPRNPPLHDAVAQLVELLTNQLLARVPQAPPQAPAPPAGHQRTRVKTRDPEPYDGTDPSKLRAFLSQCHLTFQGRPQDFAQDQIKITYAVSWLKGTALRWYEPNLELPDDELPDHAVYWPAFEEELKATFGEPDPVNTAVTKLDNLLMKDSHHIARYNVEFNEYSGQTRYNDHALYTRYYKGLAPRLKDALVLSGKPETLAELRTLTQALDIRYWERKDEDRPKLLPPAQSSSSNSSSSQSSKAHTSQHKKANKSSTPAPSSSRSKKPDISDVLGPDGKLLPEEKERRKKNNLCLICAAPDHFSDKCPSRKGPAKACAAELDTVYDDEEQGSGPASEAESSGHPN